MAKRLEADLRIQLLGGFSVAVGAEIIPAEQWKGRRARALVKLLALTPGHRLHRDQVINTLWPDSDPSAAANNFHQTLHGARRVLDTVSRGCLQLEEGFLTLSGGEAQALATDVEQFEAAAVLTKDCQDPAVFQAALALYPGDLLPEDIYEEWTRQRRETLRQTYLHLLFELSHLYEGLKDFSAAVETTHQVLALDNANEEAHAGLMRLYALGGHRQKAMRQYQELRDVLRTELGVDPSHATNQLYAAIRDDTLEKNNQPSGGVFAAAEESPFKGLQYFDVKDTGIFFGREALTARLVEHLRVIEANKSASVRSPGDKILAVVGASGSGKSSVVRAGLAPIVERNILSTTGMDHWSVQIMTPTSHPLAALAAATAEPAAVAPQDTGPRLLVVDQFEELFTLCGSESEREAFIDQLQNRADIVVITLRADFYGHCAKYPALRQALSTRQEYIGSMNVVDLRRAIEEPAHRSGWEFEQGLVDLILRDLGASSTHASEPGVLPLLSHALLETWKRRTGRMLTLKGYIDAGSVHGVISKTAERVFSSLDQGQQAITRGIFLRLIALGEGTQDTHRPVKLSELVPAGSNQESTLDVLQRLEDARLVVVEWNQATKEEEVEIAHEALIRNWPRLQSWLDENRAELRLEKRVRDAAQEWQLGGRNNSLLLHRDERLELALRAVNAGRLAFNQTEMDYLMTCRSERDREKKALERRRNMIIAISLAATLLMALIAVWGLVQADTARRQANISLAQRLAIQASEMITVPSMNEVAVLLIVESINRNPDSQANKALANSLSFFPNTISKIKLDGAVTSAIFSPDGTLAASGGSDKSVRVWDAKNGREVSRMAHAGQVWSIDFSPDGKRLVSASQDGTARVWDVKTGRELARMVNNSVIWSAAFSPDGKWIITGSGDNTARVWDAQTGREVSRVQHAGIVYSVAFSPDGKQALSASQDRTIRLWDPATGTELARMTNSSELWTAAFSPDGQSIVSGGWDGTVRVWDAKTGVEQTHMQQNGSVHSVAFNPDGSLVISGSDDGTARIWDAGSGRELARMQAGGRVLAASFSPDGKLAISGSEDGTARVWEVDTGYEVTRVQHSAPVTAVAFSPDGVQAISASNDGTARVWELLTGQEMIHMIHEGPISSVGFSPNGAQILSSSADGTARIWDAQNGRFIAQMEHGGGGITGAAFSSDQKLIVSGSKDSTARIWLAGSGQEIARLVHSQTVWAVAFSPDGKQVVTGCQDDIVRIWDLKTEKVLMQMKQDGPVSSVAFSPDGKQVISGSLDGTARVWDAVTGRELVQIKQNVPVLSVAVSSDGKLVISGSQAGIIQISSAWTGLPIRRMTNDGPVLSVAFSQDQKLVISGGQDGTARIWDAATGQELARMKQDNDVTAAAFSPDGRRVVSGGQDGEVRVWLWRNDDLIHLACSRLTRNLTLSEWRQYMGDLPYHRTCSNLPPGK